MSQCNAETHKHQLLLQIEKYGEVDSYNVAVYMLLYTEQTVRAKNAHKIVSDVFATQRKLSKMNYV